MLQRVLNNKKKIMLLILLVGLLVLVRVFESQLFYDPFLEYYKTDYSVAPLPDYKPFLLFLGLSFRYGLNMVFSLGIIYILFKEVELVRFVSFLYVFLFLVLIVVFFLALSFYGESNKLMLFYVRRFLIQPILILIFIPGFYYQKLKK